MDECSLLKLPEEVLKYIGGFLGPCDLLVSSATCHTLRTVFNDDLIWRKYTDGEISLRLDGIPSLVQPVFTPLQSCTMDPLCQNRQHFRKQSRLLHNLRHGKFVKHSTDFGMASMKFTFSRTQEITYGEEYLFVLKSNSGMKDCIQIYKIESVPYLFMTLELENHIYVDRTFIQVINNKLIVRQYHWFDVYQINLPNKDVPLLQSFQIDEHSYYERRFGHFLFYSCQSLNTVRMYNLDTLQCNHIEPKIVGTRLRVLDCSDNYVHALLCAQMIRNRYIHLFVYNMQTQNYTDFDVFFSSERRYRGFIEDSFVILVSKDGNMNCTVQLFCVERSVLVATKENIDSVSLESVLIKKRILFLPSPFGVLMLNLTNLQKVHDLKIDTNSLINRISDNYIREVEYADFSKLCLFFIIYRKYFEIWNVDNWTKVGIVKENYINHTSTVSKLIVFGLNNLSVLSYW